MYDRKTKRSLLQWLIGLVGPRLSKHLKSKQNTGDPRTCFYRVIVKTHHYFTSCLSSAVVYTHLGILSVGVREFPKISNFLAWNREVHRKCIHD